MSDLRQQVVEQARTWINTPFGHQQSIKGVAVDCCNFVGLVAQEAGVPGVPLWVNNYRRREDGAAMLAILTDGLDFIENPREVEPGDVLAFHDGRNVNAPRHLGIVSGWRGAVLYVIHASEHGVREHRLDALWWKRVHSAWRLKGV